MIPLGLWLKERSGQAAGLAQAEGDDTAAADAVTSFCTDPETPMMIARLEAEVAELTEALAAAAHSAQADRAAAAAREEELSQSLGVEMTARIVSEMKASLAQLQENLEAAVVDTLTPFLRRAMVEEASRSLIAMLRTALMDGAPVIEARAPKSLHDLLIEALGEAGAKASLKEADEVELVFSSSTARFEVLTEQWIQLIEEGRNGG